MTQSQDRIRASVAAAQAHLTKHHHVECSADSHGRQRPDVHWLNEQEIQTVSGQVDALKPGTTQVLKGGTGEARLGRADCGHLYLLTVETVRRAVDEA